MFGIFRVFLDDQTAPAIPHVSRLGLLVLTLFVLAGGVAQAQTTKSRPRGKKAQTPDPIAQSKADLIKAAQAHKLNLQQELVLLEEQVTKAAQDVEKSRALFTQGILAKRELEEREQALALARGRRDARQTEIAGTDSLIAEATAAEQIARLRPLQMGGYVTTAALIRYLGPAHWVLADITKVESFFVGRFGRTLPISAMGQSPVHDRLGFDHHEAVDVAAHPDSAEGQALIAYLRSAGISFMAFRQAVPGSATGAHIHIGPPSRRIAR